MRIERKSISQIGVMLLFAMMLSSCSDKTSCTIIDRYVYPVTTSSKEWKTFTIEEMIEVTQIPEEKLQDLSTEVLVYAFLDYPLLSAIYTYSNDGDAFQAISDQFNGLAELNLREDRIAVIDKVTGCEQLSGVQRDAVHMLLSQPVYKK